MRRDLPRFFRRLRSPRWFVVFVVAVLLCVVALTVNWLSGPLRPGTIWGWVYGASAAALLLGAAAYIVRRRVVRYAVGSAQGWLQFHVYGGTLFILLVLMHTGFRLPVGILGWSMWLLSMWLVLSGLLGLVLQRWIPALLASGLTTEVLYDRIPELVASIGEQATTLAATCDRAVRDFYERSLAASMADPQPRLIYYLDITGGIQSRTRQFDHIRGFLPAGEVEKLNNLETLFRAKLEMDAHYTLQRTLRWWLYGHVPVSVVLITLVAFHIFSILYY